MSFAVGRRVQACRQATAARQAEKIAHLQSFIDRFRYKASKARQAQSRIKALERMPALESIVEDVATRFQFPQPEQLSPPILTVSRGNVGYGNHVVLRDLDIRIDQEDRIALLGANGNGKSTLAKLLAGRMQPISGDIHRDRRMRVGYFAQHQEDDLDLEGTPLSHMIHALPRATPGQCTA